MGQKYKEKGHAYPYEIAFFALNRPFYTKKPYFCS